MRAQNVAPPLSLDVVAEAKARMQRLRVRDCFLGRVAAGIRALLEYITSAGCSVMQHYDVLWTRMKTQKSKRWQDGAKPLPKPILCISI